MPSFDYEAAAHAEGVPCTDTSREGLRACAVAQAEIAATAGCAAMVATAPVAPLCGLLAGEIAGPLFDALADAWDSLTGAAEEEALHAAQLASLAAFDAQICALQGAQQKTEAALEELYLTLEYHDPATGIAVAPPWDTQASSGWQRTPRAWIDDALAARGFGGLFDALGVLANALRRPGYTGKPWLSCTNGIASGNGLDDDRITKGFWQPVAQQTAELYAASTRRLADAAPQLFAVKVAAEAAAQAHDQAEREGSTWQQGRTPVPAPLPDSHSRWTPSLEPVPADGGSGLGAGALLVAAGGLLLLLKGRK